MKIKLFLSFSALDYDRTDADKAFCLPISIHALMVSVETVAGWLGVVLVISILIL